MGRLAKARRRVTGGVDTHAEVHVAVVVDSATGHVLGTGCFETTPRGYRALLGWMRGKGVVDKVGVEGTGCYGVGLTRHLTAMGVEVVEVDRPDRRARRRHGKSDPVDAEAAARAALSGRATGTPKQRDGLVEAIRTLRVVHESARKNHQQAGAQFRALVLTAPDEVRTRLRGMPLKRQLERAARMHASGSRDPVTRELCWALRTLARRVMALESEQHELERRLRPLVKSVSPALLGLQGVGIHMAAELLVAAGDNPERLRSEAAFAHLCGVAPVPASSGKVTRHRLNRGGNRRANHALWRVVMVRMAHDERTRAYVQRRTEEGRTKREIIRCLKRYVAREVYQAIRRPACEAPTGRTLRALRRRLQLPLRVIADDLGITQIRLSRIERELDFDTSLARRAEAYLRTAGAVASAA